MENTVEAEMRVVDVLDNVADIVETGTRVMIVVVAFWANAVPTRALKTRRIFSATIVVKQEASRTTTRYGSWVRLLYGKLKIDWRFPEENHRSRISG